MKLNIIHRPRGANFNRGWFVQSLNNPTMTAINSDDYNKIWLFIR